MNSHTTKGFRELLAKLPARIRRQAREAHRWFQDDPSHPGLHFKQVCADPLIYSARVGIGHRALASRD